MYNLTPYLKFHPGGESILMKVAGRDGTALFNKFHAWVNADFLLAKCQVGLLAAPAAAAAQPAAAQQQQHRRSVLGEGPGTDALAL